MNSKTKMRYTSEKGITLIALVITIIVLLILAGVTISMVLGDDGIIQNAQQAKKQNEDASLKDAISVAKADAATAQYVKQTPVALNNLGDIKTRIDAYNTANPTATYTYENTVAKVVEGVPIPIGFAYVQGTKVDTGLIVVDGYGNEYVWVPVDGENVQLELDSTYSGWKGEETSTGLDTTIVPAGTIESERAAMAQSVEIYGGFYVGRYETSWTGSRVASVPNVTSMSGSTQVDGSGANWYTFYNKQKELYNKESDSVVSGMIYGSQWDAIMDWMSDVENPNAVDPDNNLYINDSTGMGHFNSFSPIKTGSNSAYSVKNIFDLAGNYFEWSQEDYDSDGRVFRGGGCHDSGSLFPASLRNGDVPDYAGVSDSSRLQLYIK